MIHDAKRTPYDDSYATCERTFAELRIYTGDIDPEDVSQRLRLSPSVLNKKGALRYSSAGRVRTVPKNGWFLSSEGEVESRDLRRHLDWLLLRLDRNRDELRKLQEEPGIQMSITCIWWSAHGDGGPTLWPQQMKLMAELGLECAFEVAFFGLEED